MVERVAGSGTYVRARSARATFGLLIPRLGETEIFEPICRGLAAAAAQSKTALLWGEAGESAEATLRLCDEYIERRVAGVFFTAIEERDDAETTNAEIIDRLGRARVPVVLLDRDYVRYPRRSGHDLVGIDNRRAGYLATEHLVSRGSRRVAFLGSALGAATVEARAAGYREALGTAGYDPERILRPARVDRAELADTQKRIAADAYVCANDRWAGELMHALLGAGYRIPEDVRVAGIDDVEYASLLPVPLTTVRQPCRDIGEAAIAAMAERIARPRVPSREILLECRLVVRQSSG